MTTSMDKSNEKKTDEKKENNFYLNWKMKTPAPYFGSGELERAFKLLSSERILY